MNRVGIGIDTETISRFQKLNRTQHRTFLQKIYTLKELSYCFSKAYPPQHLAARFAAKEAVLKALSALGRAKIPLNTIEICNDQKGTPSVNLLTAERGKLCLKISLSHDHDKALAFALAIRGT